MTSATQTAQLEQLVRKIDQHSRLVRAWPLTGGVSAQVTALEIERADGQTTKLIVRQHGAVDLRHNPNIASDEYRLLQILHSAGLATPRPYLVDQSAEIFATPCVVIAYIEGAPEFTPANLSDLTLQMATHLAKIHTLDSANPALAFLPPIEERYAARLAERPAQLDAALAEERIRQTLQSIWPLPRRNRSALLHGDFWPGNLLWQDQRLVAVIDWEDAALGDPLADLANTRLELLWAFGVDALHAFTRQYQALATIDLTDLPSWDLCAALRPIANIAEWTDDASTRQAMRSGLRWFIDQAFAGLHS